MNILIIGNADNPSNQRIVDEAKNLGHFVQIVDMRDISISVEHDASSILINNIPLETHQFHVALFRDITVFPFLSVYLSLVHVFQRAGIRIANQELSGTFIYNKLHQMIECQRARIPIPHTTYLAHENALKTIAHSHEFPVVIKPIHGSHGVDVARCDTMQALSEHAQKADWGTYIVQNYLEAESDYRVIVINGTALGAVKKTPAKGDFRTNTDAGATFTACRMTNIMKEYAERASIALHCTIAGVDMREHQGTMHVLEINRNPGFDAFEQASGINVAAEIVLYLTKLSL